MKEKIPDPHSIMHSRTWQNTGMSENLPLTELLESWTLALRAERKAPGTVRLYRTGVLAYLRWCESSTSIEVVELSKATAQAWVADHLANGAEAATAHARLKG
ncbi:MAG TPA: site-specific integrase, partial [Mycobacterium sp.]